MGMAEKVKELREARKWSQADLAGRVGVSQVAINKIETGDTKRTRFLPDLARVLGVTPEVLMDEPAPRIGYNPPPDFFGPRDLPVYSGAEGGPGAMVVNTDPIEFVPRPWFFKQVKDGYAVIVNGSSMDPVYEPGDMLLVNPSAPLVKGKDVILVRGEEHGQFDASIKRLMDWTSAEWILRQFNPPEGEKENFRRFRHEWPKALRVVGKYSGG